MSGICNKDHNLYTECRNTEQEAMHCNRLVKYLNNSIKQSPLRPQELNNTCVKDWMGSERLDFSCISINKRKKINRILRLSTRKTIRNIENLIPIKHHTETSEFELFFKTEIGRLCLFFLRYWHYSSSRERTNYGIMEFDRRRRD